jgi:excisionase family DNA binding protein
MTKEDAAAFLGVSTRAIERYTSSGRLSVRYEKGKTRPRAIYNKEELIQLKAELENPSLIRPQVQQPGASNNQSLAIAPTKPDTQFAEFVGVVASAFEQARSHHVIVPLADKLTLNLQEAAALSGLSKQRLRDAIREKKLKAQIIGRGWRVKRDDLEAYIKKL